jgi:Helicase HerA, central domain
MNDPEHGRSLEGATFLRRGARYQAPLLVGRFPPEVPFGFLGRVLPASEPLEMSLEALRVPAREALTLVHGSQAVAEAELSAGGGDAATPEIELERDAAEALGRDLARRSQELWKVGLRWTAVGVSRPRVEAVRARLADRLAALGFRTRIPRYETAAALAPIIPGRTGARPTGYWQTLSTDGLAALFPFVDETVLERNGILIGLGLADASPIFLDRWSHASYSWGIFGTTGAGKSFAAALYLLRTRWMRPETEVVVLDPLGEYTELVRALGGAVVSVGSASNGRLNPLDPTTTGGDRTEKAARVGAMLRALFPSLRDEESAALDAAISRLYDRGLDEPVFADLIGSIEQDPRAPPRLAGLLEIFRSGSLRRLNGRSDLAPTAALVAVDLRDVAADHLPFHLTYLLDWAYGRLRDRPGPKLLIVDEAHRLAAHPATAEFLDRVVRHVRHFEAGVLLLSQSPDDFLAQPSGRSLLRNLYAAALLRLPEVSRDAREFFGLTVPEAEWLPKARLPRDVGYAESLWRVGEMHLPLAIVASTPEWQFLTEKLGAGPAPVH